VGESDGVPTPRPRDRFDPAFLQQPGGVRGIRRATISNRVLPDLGSLRSHEITFAAGEPGLRLEIDGVTGSWSVGASH
jgi:hypothetical protein